MDRWIYNVWSEEKISAEEHGNRLKQNSMRNCLQNRGVEWVGHVEEMGKSSWSRKYRILAVASLSKGLSRKTWSEVIISYLKEMKVSEDLER